MPAFVEPITHDPHQFELRLEQADDDATGQQDVGFHIKTICADVLKIDVDDLDETRSFLSLGGDSLLAIKVMARCKAKGIAVNISDMVEAASIAELYHRAFLQASQAVWNGKLINSNDPIRLSTDASSEPSLLQEVSVTTSSIEARMPRESIPIRDDSLLLPSTDTGLDPLIRDKLEQILPSGNQSVQSILPCSPIQKGLVISQSTNPHLYQCRYLLRFTSCPEGLPIDALRFGAAWIEVVKRHASLRTVLVDGLTQQGQFDQVILKEFQPSIEYSQGPQDVLTTNGDWQEFVPFHPSEVPHRVQLVQASPTEVYMKLEISHALVDGQSTEVLLRDLYAAYSGAPTFTPALSYGEFASYHSQLPTESSRAYWSEYLSDAQPSFLPMDQGHEKPSNLNTLSLKIEFDDGSLPEFCGAHSVTVANICQLAWGLVLRCFTGSDNVCFSYITSGRSISIEGLDDAVGPFVDTQLCSLKIDGMSLVTDLLRRISRDSFKGLSHHYTLDTSNASTNQKSARQLSNTSMSFQRAFEGFVSREAGIALSIINKSNPTDYDIALGIEAWRNGLNIELDFWRSRMDRSHADAVLKTFREAIYAVMQAPRGTISDISLLNEPDKAKLKVWNRDVPPAVRRCVHDKVAERAQQQPNATAVHAWDGDLTYSELITKASALAHDLIDIGVGPEQMVVICMNKSKWAVVSMLAVLQAGGVVVPLGVSHPVARIKALVADTAAKVILVDQGQADRLAELSIEACLITVDSKLLASLPARTEVPKTTITPDNAAWVIFTSGSTGTPKGVVLEHTSLSTSMQAHGKAFGVGPDTRAAQFASYTFDVSISDIFTILHFGGCVCVFSEESRMNSLTEALQAFKVNYVNMTPTVLSLLDPADHPQIKTVVAGGEPLDPTIVRRWSEHAKVINSYGPSECAIISVANPVWDPNQASNVGYPTGTRLWVTEATDPDKLCPIGAQGELLIEGPLLSRGYLNDANKSAAAFVNDPGFIKQLGLQSGHHRMYRTGDLVRQNEDGSLTHLGRRDTQVKIRGQRVEIGEIEYWITHHLRDARMVAVIVIDRGRDREQKGLVAVIEFTEHSKHHAAYTDAPTDTYDDTPTIQPPTEALSKALHHLQQSLFEVLPAYMVPSMYLPVLQMPLNISGKLDRRAVRDLVAGIESERLQCYTATNNQVDIVALTSTEQQLQALWAKALGIDANLINTRSHFFQIGGDSVAAIRIVSAARNSKSQFRMTVADIFQYPHLSDLAHMLDGRAATQVEPSAMETQQMDTAPFTLWKEATGMIPEEVEKQLDEIAAQCGVRVEQIEDVYSCTSLQEGLIAITARQPTAYVSRQAFSLDDTINASRFQKAWQTIVLSNPILRTRILFGQQTGSFQVVVRGEMPWQYSSSLETYLDADRTAGMAPGQPLNRVGFVEEPSGKRFFVWTAHHSTYDGWSMNLIFQQIQQVYLENTVPHVVPYTRFIRYLSQVNVEATTKYWREQLRGDVAADFPPLPRANYQPHPRQRVRRQIDLQGLTRSEVMLSDVLRAAWGLVVAQHAGHDDPVFTVALSGRNAPVADIESIVAPIITTVPLHMHVDRTQTVQDFLHAVRQQAIQMMPYEHTGLQRIKQLVSNLGDALDLRHLFLIQPSTEDEAARSFPEMQAVAIPTDEFDSYALNIECTLGSDAVQIDVRFDENVILSVKVERMLEQFIYVVQQLFDPAAIGRSVGDISLASPQDLRQIKEWNSTVPPATKRCIHELVIEMSQRQPNAPAICAWDGSFSFSEMIAQVTILANYLVNLGIGPELMVGICMDKSKWAIIAMLAILQAGGVVVPLGVSHPLSRIQGIISDSAVKVILVDHEQAIRLDNSARHIVTVNSKLIASLPLQMEPPRTAVTPENAAWVIFTSGSTGTPKGVILEHTALCTSLLTHGARFGMGPHTRSIQFAAHTFDAVIQDCFTTLIQGGTVCVPSEDDRMNNLAGVMHSMEVNFASLTPTVAQLLTPTEVPTLRTMVLGGEPLQPAVVETWYKHADILNSYGPSECSIYSTCNGPLTDPSQAPNIGVAMGTRLWVTEANNPDRLCGIGAPGEILIEGPLLARGYLNDAKKTAEAFITDPAWTKQLGLSGCRLYRTGDLVRQNEDGTFTHLGRRDMQIKIRGQRVEVGEIEYWISQKLNDTRFVAVMKTDRDKGQQRGLAAVIQFSENSVHHGACMDDSNLLPPSGPLSEAFHQLQKSLFELLPAYMVPSLYVPIVKMPLNTSSKLDRLAVSELLESIETDQLQLYITTDNEKAAASTETEKWLQALWAQALGIQDIELVGANDQFFQIGGDSVTAMRIVAAARNGQLHLTVADIFEHPRLSELAHVLDTRGVTVTKPEDTESIPFELWKEAIGIELDLGLE